MLRRLLALAALILCSAPADAGAPTLLTLGADRTATPAIVCVVNAGACLAPIGTFSAGGVWTPKNALVPGNNLSDLGSPATARTNLGLGAAATAGIGPGVGQVAAGCSVATGGTACLDAGSRAGLTVNVRDFGAKGDDVADDTASINAALAFARSVSRQIGLGYPSITGQATVVNFVIPHGVYRTTGTLNWTGFNSLNVKFDCNGSAIDGQVTGVPVVDALGSRWLNVDDLVINGNPNFSATVGLQLGRSSTANADDHLWRNITVAGSFSFAGVYDLSAETTEFDHLKIWNSNGSPGSYGLVLDGINHFNVQSQFVSVTLPVDSLRSFNEAYFPNASILVSGSGVPIWMAATNRTKFVDSYAASRSYGVVLYASATFPITMADMDVHFETSAITDIFYVDGPSSTAQASIRGLMYRDQYPEPSNSLFKVNTTNIASVAMTNADIQISQYYSSQALVFNDPSIWTVQGRYTQSIGSGNWNLASASFSGELCIAGKCSRPALNILAGGSTPITLTAPIADPTASIVLGAASNLAKTSTAGGGTNGISNIAIGANVLPNNTTGGLNTAIGTTALNQNTAGGSNTAIGYASLYSNLTGSQNMAIGVNALFANTSGIRNTGIGNSALKSNTGSSQNTAIGGSALSTANPGVSNGNDTAIGFSAGAGVTNGTDNTLIGMNAGSVVSSGASNVIIGESGNITTGSSNILIGNNLTGTTATGSNQIDIGDTLVGSLATSGNNAAANWKGTMKPLAGLQLPATTVASLPTCNASEQDIMYVVTDATSPTYRGALTGGGSVRTPVYCDGSSWTAH